MYWICRLAFILAVVHLHGCYDGWDAVADKPGAPNKDPNPNPAKRPLYFVQFDPIYLSSSAMTSTCFGATGTEAFRAKEWSLRIAVIQANLGAIAETVVTRETLVTNSNCTTLSIVETQSVTLDNNLLNLPDDPLDRPIVHLKAVFWDTDVGATPSTSVITRDWATQRVLKNRGRRSFSYLYLSQSNQQNGFFKSWFSAFPSAVSLRATPIDTVDPSDAGIAARLATANSDGTALVNWLLSKATTER
ncbi:MAG: hypothetical protein NTV34_17365 [Proteobacteria bacterium]|nr:hypothetical protein [Pseudomonadota bacterium]